MTKDPVIFLQHILESIEIIEDFIKDSNKSEFLHSIQLQEALVRRLEIIGEATKNLPKNYRRKYVHVKWHEMAGMRDKLIHHYFCIDLHVVWDVIKKDLPGLKKQIQKILKEAGEY